MAADTESVHGQSRLSHHRWRKRWSGPCGTSIGRSCNACTTGRGWTRYAAGGKGPQFHFEQVFERWPFRCPPTFLDYLAEIEAATPPEVREHAARIYGVEAGA